MKSRDLTGKQLGEYKIIEHIGRGATADVYKAFQPSLNRHVGIKVLSPFVSDKEAFRKRFTREAKAVAQLDHPNILPVYGFDQQDNQVYLVMRYVDTGSLADTLADMQGEPMSLDRTLKIMEQVGSALSHAHNRGIIHRDVKPGNILLGSDNWVLLTDFGLVKILEESTAITQSGVGVGTPNYMAPEQVRGDPVDARADIYALGAMLYQILTGTVPFEGESGIAVALKHINEEPTPPRVVNPDLSPAVEQVILKALIKDRELRYQSTEEFVTAFREATFTTSPTPSSISVTKPPQEATSPHFQIAQVQSRLAPISTSSIWPPEGMESSARGGNGWTLLLALAGTLVGFSLLLWRMAIWLNTILAQLP
ncbi:MAG: serine/threonine protein kinase [Chloroflexi bacterium]|nr:serine/threonine protein kinase [Chloroflexota bacterium]